MSNEPTTNDSSANSAALARLQDQLGYTFDDPALLQLALTHKSFAKQNNERLEFLGDAVLGYLIAEMLYRRNERVREDGLSLMRASVVRGSVLAQVARGLQLGPNLRLGSGERKSGGRDRDSILADAMEAVLGAMHEDGGIDPCRKVVADLFGGMLVQLDPDKLKDAKTRLQEHLQGRRIELPAYVVEEVGGADHKRQYTVSCSVPELELRSDAKSTSRRGAEQAAAAAMLELLDDRVVQERGPGDE